MVFNNQRLAFDFVQRVVSRVESCFYSRGFVNKNRHMILKPSVLGKPVFYVIFKREWFCSFNRWFEEYVKENTGGFAQSINEEFLGLACKEADYILFVMGDERIYKISPWLWKKYADKHGLLRKQKKQNEYALGDFCNGKMSVNEVTYCIPAVMLESYGVKRIC